MSKYTLLKIYITLAILLGAVAAETAFAFSTAAYAPESRLAGGHLVKVRVDKDGLYLITKAKLKAWGFDPERTRVYGYGGRRLPDLLIESNYIDDLPEVQSELTDKGIVFFGRAAGEWKRNTGEVYSYHQNDFSNYGYYFIGESDSEERREIPVTGTAEAVEPAKTYNCRTHYEKELTLVPGEAGPALLGENFRYNRAYTFSFNTTDAVEGTASFEVSFVSDLSGSNGCLYFTVNDEQLTTISSDRVSTTPTSNYIHGVETVTAHSFACTTTQRNTIDLGIRFETAGSCTGAWLNYISLNYPRALRLPAEGNLLFNSAADAFELEGTTAGVRVWDTTDPAAVVAMNVSDGTAGTCVWATDSRNTREYVAWNPNATLPEPATVGTVPAQNLHADSDLDMVIVAPSQFIEQAERLADLHRNSDDSLTVKVVSPEVIYNEFSSGNPDPGAFRRYFKMLYDRGNAGIGRPLRYAILMGRTTIDNRGLSTGAPNYPTLPSWMPTAVRASLSDNEGYCTDDVAAMLADGSGTNMRTDKLSIAIGRIPVVSAAEAREVVDKAYQYARNSRKTAWKHRYMFFADDQDNSIHMKQSEAMISQFEKTPRQQHLVRKVYMDSYPFEGATYPEARSTMFRYLDEGVVWWNYVGHANTTGWTAEGMLSYTDLNNMYLRNWPFIYAATCDFLRLDGTNITGGEILYKERYGGAIGIISAVRPVYISDNGNLSNAMGRALAVRDRKGQLLTPGEIYRRAKNDIRDSNGTIIGDTNRLRYVFIGDPALRLAMPSNIVRLDSIGTTPVGGDEQPVMRALEQVKISGTVTDPDGTALSAFNGVVLVDIFDAERSRMTLGSRNESTEEPFQDYGERIFCGSAEVHDGRFELTVSMPFELSQNYRPAAMSLYAYSTDDDTEAVGLNREFYVYGFDETAEADTEAPEIETLVMNHSSFRNGDAVNNSPMMIATVSDNVGINMSTAGIGHQMTAILDGNQAYSDLSYYYTPSADGSPSGVINYPLENLQAGNHTLALRVWDTAGNSATKEINFFVKENLAPKIYDVYTDANPASTVANFYISHDQPDNMLTVVVTVYNLLGQPVWSGQATGRSDMFRTVPVTWDLSGTGGQRVGRGIYLYRADITADGQTYSTASRKIAVTAQ